MLQILEAEGVRFAAIHVDPSFEEENKPTRKPRTGMLQQYMYGKYDLENSYVIGDRATDMQLAANLGCKAICIGNSEGAELNTMDWREVYQFLKSKPRKASVTRTTSETSISISINLDGSGQSSVTTGIGFFDHMLQQIAKHGNIDLFITAKGDTHIDEHHTIEDTGITLGEAFVKALGSKRGIERYGFALPMDDCLAQAAIDFGGRPWIEWDVQFKREKIGEMPTEMFFHFFKSFSDNARCNLNIKCEGENEHHKIEAVFKAFAKAVKMAVQQNNQFQIPSTKGVL
jgi:imidazoleglycerol-phosphate dehydratase / histidinol-phosphatase